METVPLSVSPWLEVRRRPWRFQLLVVSRVFHGRGAPTKEPAAADVHREEPGSTAYLPTGHSVSFESPSTATNQPGFANVHSVAPAASEKDPAEQAKHALAPGPGE